LFSPKLSGVIRQDALDRQCSRGDGRVYIYE
jgi:hypothetical protein